MGVLHAWVSVYAPHISSTQRGQKRASGTRLKLTDSCESPLWELGIEPGSPGTAQSSYLRFHVSNLLANLFKPFSSNMK